MSALLHGTAINGMQQKLDYLDIRILESLGIYGPRSLSSLARKLNLDRATLWKRVKRLSSLFLLKFNANPYHTNLGLRKAIVLAWAMPGQEDFLFDCLYINDFRNFISRCYGTSEGCFAIYTIPNENIPEFEQFLREIEKLGLTKNVQVQWSTCFQNVNLTSTWYNAESETWVFPWENWIEELTSEATKLPYTLIDPEAFLIKADEVDLFIIKELEKDATISFVNIAKKLGVSRQTIEHHYRKHILRRRLIESIQVTVAPFDPKGISYPLVFNFRFEDDKRMAMFALSLLDKPFAHFIGKILNENALVAYLHFLSREDFRGFIDALSKVIQQGSLQDYNYVFVDQKRTARETVRYEFFEDGAWIYEHYKHMKKLQDLVRQAKSESLIPLGRGA